MEKATCGFCHRDDSQDIEEVCGNLHVEKLNGKYIGKYIAAHHKCLVFNLHLIYRIYSFLLLLICLLFTYIMKLEWKKNMSKFNFDNLMSVLHILC